MGNPDLPKQMKSNFLNVSIPRLLAYAEKNKLKHQSVLDELEQAIDTGCLDEGTQLYMA